MSMVKKVTSKNVIDYDPLAWLEENEHDQNQPDSKTTKKVSAKKKSPVKKAAKKKSVVNTNC